jgi:hypothetical protein
MTSLRVAAWKIAGSRREGTGVIDLDATFDQALFNVAGGPTVAQASAAPRFKAGMHLPQLMDGTLMLRG